MLAFIFVSPITFSDSSAKRTNLSIMGAKLYYKDTLTKSGKTVYREFKSFSDDKYWSKPKKVDLKLLLKNSGNREALYLKVMPELYFLVGKKIDGENYPSLTKLSSHSELKDLLKTNNRVWVWNRTLGKFAHRSLQAKKEVNVYINNMDISYPYYASDYTIYGFAVRVFVSSKWFDTAYKDNVKDFIFYYSM